jgi:hypothetical protein
LFWIAACWLFPGVGLTQDAQLLFDPNGNLLVQRAAATAPPEILGQPQDRIVGPGESATFSVVAANTHSLAYQWRFNGANIGGATGDAFLLPSATPSSEGEYRVVLTNPSGSVTSAPAMLWLDSDFDGMADSWETTHFGSLTNSATADLDGDGVSNLQEFLDDTDPANSASARYRLLVLRDGGSVIKTLDRTTYTNGELVTLTGVSAPGAEPFHAWLGDIVTRSNPVTVMMTNNKTIYARFTPIVFTWTNLASGDWNTATNWTPNLAPGSNDTVVITSGVTVTLNTPADCADLTLGSPGANPTLIAGNLLTVRSTFLWISGAMTGSGRTILEPGATLELANPGSGVFSMNGRTLENGGTVLSSGAGSLGLNSGAVITNRPGGLFDVRTAAGLGAFFGVNRFDNAGIFRKSMDAGTATIGSGLAFNNSGTVEIQTGTLNLGGGGTHTGSFDVRVDTTLNLSGGTHSAGASSSITGDGQFTVSGGTANIAGLVNVSGSNIFSGGTANLTGNYICRNNTLAISGSATANLSGNGDASPAVLDLRDSATLGGTNIVTVGHVLHWTGGSMSGNGRTIIAPGATAVVDSPFAISFALSSRALENGGTMVWSGTGTLALAAGAILTNRPGGLFQVQNDKNVSSSFGANRFDNAGTFRKSGGTGTTTFGVNFNNYGAVEIQSGTLNLAGGATQSASSSITGAGHLTFSGGTATLAGLVNVSGSNLFSGGTANLTGNYICTNNTLTLSVSGTANFSGTGEVSPAILDLRDSATLGGTNNVTVGSVLNWTGGNMSGSGRTIIAPGALATVSSPFGIEFSLSGRTLENGGTLVWSGVGSLGLFSGAVITNRPGALFHVQNAASISSIPGPARFDNAGTFRKSVSTGTTTFASGVPFNNFGTVDIRSGILAANGDYASSSNAVLNCTLGGTSPGTNYGQLQVAGAVTLNGALSVDLVNGFSPALNDSFTVLTAGTRSSTFGSFIYPSNTVTMQLSNTPNSVIVRVTDAAASPPVFDPVSPLTGSNETFSFTWSAIPGRLYQVQFKNSLADTTWTDLGSPVIAASATATLNDAIGANPQRYYRVGLLP